jgi:hypothetical protein
MVFFHAVQPRSTGGPWQSDDLAFAQSENENQHVGGMEPTEATEPIDRIVPMEPLD